MKVYQLSNLLSSVALLSGSLSKASTDKRCPSFPANLSLPHDAQILSTEFHLPGFVNATRDSIDYITNQYGFCQVNAAIAYGSNDSLHFTVWLPESPYWNGRFMTVGNGGLAGYIDQFALSQQLNAGFAVAGGDSGHLKSLNNDGVGAPDTYFPFLHDPNQVNAWIHDSIALYVPAAKQLSELFFGHQIRYSYYIGCSTGGAQGFALAQYHPDLFDGIIAGCPGNWYSHLALSFLWNQQQTSDNSTYLPQSALNLISEAVLDECDAIDGVEDRLIENPTVCVFDISSLECNSTGLGGNETECLTTEQVAAARQIYAGPKNPQTGLEYYPGFSFGSEIQWLLQEGDLANLFAIPILQNLVFDNLTYDSSTFDWSSDVAIVDEMAGQYIDEISVNLTAFRDGGGKMLVHQGWSDPLNAQIWPIQHLEDVQDFFDGDVSDFYNLYMIPGGGHCSYASYYTTVPKDHHFVAALVQWVERGVKPREILSENPYDGSTRSRKLCPWPEKAVYVQGDIDDWNSYTCEG